MASSLLKGIFLPVAALAFGLSSQCLGWFHGVMTFETLNSDALLFAFYLGSLGGLWYLYKTLDATTLASEPFWKSGFWIFFGIGVIWPCGIALLKPLFSAG